MQSKNLLYALLLAALAVAPRVSRADDLDRVLRRLDAASANFQSTQAECQVDSVVSDPIPDKETQKGTVYYERHGKQFRMSFHIHEVNGRPVPKVYVYAGGQFQLYEKLSNQVTTLTKLSQYESWFMLGFGASGKDLAEKWEIKYLGPETLPDGHPTDKLELIAKDPAIRQKLPKVTVWIDPESGVSRKQVFDEGSGQYRVSVYFNVKVNQPLPSNAFTLPTDSKTTRVTR